MAPKSTPRMTIAQRDSIVSIGKAARATRYDDILEQRAFLDEKVENLDSYSPFMREICDTLVLSEVAYHLKQSYHQTAGINGGVIAGRYPVLVDFIARMKAEKERVKSGILLLEQQHRVGLDDVRTAKDAQEAEIATAREAARASKEAKKALKKPKKTKRATVEDGDDDVSILDDGEVAQALLNESDDIMLIDTSETKMCLKCLTPLCQEVQPTILSLQAASKLDLINYCL
ncbi:hypothetical protein B0H15DRAFT_805723 [Mycena belliarum]|uniref:Uncharacterized protein n=1 Tax=Mycena belliarum TaxID=1033014 RepID=A0AAD6XI57_9AGAR|nr:hypothetical protein B0H15DRAFT_805723 [Mycena belliae]